MLLKRVVQVSWPFYEPQLDAQREVECAIRPGKNDHCRFLSSLLQVCIERWEYYPLCANLCVHNYRIVGVLLVLVIGLAQGTFALASYRRLSFLANRLGTTFEC
jgi:hypothetical protein